MTPEPRTRRGCFAPREVGGDPPPVRSGRGAEPRPATTHAPRIHDPGIDERRAVPGTANWACGNRYATRARACIHDPRRAAQTAHATVTGREGSAAGDGTAA